MIAKLVWIFLIPLMLAADDLKALLDFATSNNKIVQAKTIMTQSHGKRVDSAESSYYPTLDVDANFNRDDPRTPFVPGETYGASASVSYDIYTGGRRSGELKQSESLKASSQYDLSAYKKELQYSIATDFFNIKSVEAELSALYDKQNRLVAELDRMKKFYNVGSVTQDAIDRLQAAYSDNSYQIDATKFQLLSLKQLLSIKLGKKVTTLESSEVVKPEQVEKETSDAIRAREKESDSIKFRADVVDAAYYPQISISDTYGYTDYGYFDDLHPEGPGQQNQIIATLTLTVFDFGKVSNEREAILLEKMSMEKEIEQLKETQDIHVGLAMSKIQITLAQIQSAKKSIESADSNYKIVENKYKVGVADNVTYLDALSVKTNAKAQYARALNDLQIAYAAYYYYTNKNILEFVK